MPIFNFLLVEGMFCCQGHWQVGLWRTRDQEPAAHGCFVNLLDQLSTQHGPVQAHILGLAQFIDPKVRWNHYWDSSSYLRVSTGCSTRYDEFMYFQTNFKLPTQFYDFVYFPLLKKTKKGRLCWDWWLFGLWILSRPDKYNYRTNTEDPRILDGKIKDSFKNISKNLLNFMKREKKREKKTVVDEEKQRVILCLTESFSVFLHLHLSIFFLCKSFYLYNVYFVS